MIEMRQVRQFSNSSSLSLWKIIGSGTPLLQYLPFEFAKELQRSLYCLPYNNDQMCPQWTMADEFNQITYSMVRHKWTLPRRLLIEIKWNLHKLLGPDCGKVQIQTRLRKLCLPRHKLGETHFSKSSIGALQRLGLNGLCCGRSEMVDLLKSSSLVPLIIQAKHLNKMDP